MKRILPFVVCLVCLTAVAWAQDESDYQKWMKTVGPTVASLNKNLAAKSGDAAAADAKTLAGIFDQVHGYWQKKSVDDAVKFAADAQSGFKQVGDLAAAGKFDEASAAVKTTQANCAGCHMAHREKEADGSFKMK